MLCDDLEGHHRTGVGWEGGLQRRRYIYTRSWFTLLYSRNQQHCKAITIKKKNTARIKLIFLGFETGHLVYLVTHTWIFHTRFFLSLHGLKPQQPSHGIGSSWMQLPDRGFCLLFRKPSGFIVVSWNSRGHLALSSCHWNTQLGEVMFSRMEI